MPKKPEKKLPPYVFEKDDRWYVKIGVATDRRNEKGKLIYDQHVRACHPKTAERAAEIVDYLRGSSQDAKESAERPTVSEFLEHFLRSKSDVSKRTHGYYQDLYDRHLKNAAFGKMLVAEVAPESAQQFFNDLKARHSGDMVRRVYTLLAMAFKYAVLWKRATTNPFTGVILPKHRQKETDAMSPDEVKRFLAVCQTDPHRFFIFEFMLETGLRPQEALALTWNSVDLDRKRVRVTQALIEGVSGSPLFVDVPKTESSHRTVSFSSDVRDKMINHLGWQNAVQIDLGLQLKKPLILEHMKSRGVNYEIRKTHRETVCEVLRNLEKWNLVFPAANGALRSRGNLNRRDFKPLLVLAGIDPKKYSVKSLRHTNASLLAEQIHPKKLQKRLGHSRLETTLKFYVHVDEGSDGEVSENFAKSLQQEAIA